MSVFRYPFAFTEDDANEIKGSLDLEEPLPFENNRGSGFFRPGRLTLEGCESLNLVFYHSQATAALMYLRNLPVDRRLMEFTGLDADYVAQTRQLILPGQLCLGSHRSKLMGAAISDVIGSPAMSARLKGCQQQNIAVFPIAREGLKYQATEAIFDNYGFYCDEIILDAHHVFDSSVPVYNRKVEMTLFKDKDLDISQKQNIAVAFIADSIASGLVMKETILKVKERFSAIERIEVLAPLATIRGLSRLARGDCAQKLGTRVHVFETILNALPPDYYYSAHYNVPELHIRPDLEKEYREWWGRDSAGNWIADTACAGYGWSESFFSPRKQIEMINSQLESRHQLKIAEIIERNIDRFS
ncbi:MAG TPA: hypothetical protein VMT46_00905 [Anaerolineaceae bacterium]|nr:hypothetical protein [Anaerolineaceae bacterium]